MRSIIQRIIGLSTRWKILIPLGLVALFGSGWVWLTIPNPPSAVMAVAQSSSSIQLDWTDNSMDETGFLIQMSTEETTGFFEKGTVGADVTTFLVTGLAQASTTYYFRVIATGTSGNSNFAAGSAATLAPDPPTNLTASSITAISVDLSWQDNTNVETGFQIERSPGTEDNFSAIAIVDANVTSFTVNGLSSQTSYEFRVAAKLGPNVDDLTGYSNEVPVTTLAPVVPNGTPNNLTATALSTSEISISWSDNSSNETGFSVEQSDFIAGLFREVASLGANQTTYTATNLEANSKYFFRVAAFNDEGSTDFSLTASATTDIDAPLPPRNLQATSVGNDNIIIEWIDDATFEDGFRVQISRNEAPFETVSELGKDSEKDTITDLMEATIYRIRVLAFNSTGESASNSILVTTTEDPPNAPTNLTFTINDDGTEVTLNWEDNSDNEESFIIERSTVSSTTDFEELDEIDPDMTQYVDVIESGINYFYRVQAGNSGGLSDFTNVTGTVLTSVDHDISTHIMIYPNPSSGIVNVHLSQSHQTLKDIRVLNMNGMIVYQLNNDQIREDIQLDLSSLNEGLYVIQFVNHTKTLQKRLVLRR